MFLKGNCHCQNQGHSCGLLQKLGTSEKKSSEIVVHITGRGP